MAVIVGIPIVGLCLLDFLSMLQGEDAEFFNSLCPISYILCCRYDATLSDRKNLHSIKHGGEIDVAQQDFSDQCSISETSVTS